MNDLLPCPFCGNEARMVQLAELPEDDPNWNGWFVECCNASCAATTNIHFGEADRELRGKWNRRVVRTIPPESWEWAKNEAAISRPDETAELLASAKAALYNLEYNMIDSARVALRLGISRANQGGTAGTPARDAAETGRTCERCHGSGEGKGWTQGHGPDDFEIDIPCPDCGGTGEKPSAHFLIARMDLRWDGLQCHLEGPLFGEVKDALRAFARLSVGKES